jgi:hypothetical protein
MKEFICIDTSQSALKYKTDLIIPTVQKGYAI